MEYNHFCEKVKKAVSTTLGEEVKVDITEVRKNNGLILKGLVIHRPESRISPTIYLEQFYEMYEDGETFADCMRGILDCEKRNRGADLSADIYTDYERVRTRLVYKIVNLEMNRELLGTVPHKQWNDLALVFCCMLDASSGGCASILVKNDHMKMWGVGVDDICREAAKNTPVILKERLDTMQDILNMECPYELPPLYVLTNDKKVFGAGAMLYSEYMKELADRYECGLYILPSSIHEVILLPECAACDADYMISMIRQINRTEVDVEDRLSDNLYFYDRGTGQISVHTCDEEACAV